MKEDYKGITVNERLVVSGLLKDFDKTVWNKDGAKLTDILKAVELDED